MESWATEACRDRRYSILSPPLAPPRTRHLVKAGSKVDASAHAGNGARTRGGCSLEVSFVTPFVEAMICYAGTKQLDQAPLRAHRKKCLQQRRPPQNLRRDRKPAHPGIERVEATVQARQRLIGQSTDHSQRMIGRDASLQPNVAEKTLVPVAHRKSLRPPGVNHIPKPNGDFFSSLPTAFASSRRRTHQRKTPGGSLRRVSCIQS